MFDGPVDAIWVENLNTVLDDSMMLCLSNGERIKLNLSLRILFEVLDLNQASPATVSRCGMIWVSEEVVPWEELINSYLLKNRLIQNEEILAFLGNLVKVSFRKGYMHIRKFAKEAVKLNASTIVHSYCKLLSTIVPLIPEEAFLTETWKRTV